MERPPIPAGVDLKQDRRGDIIAASVVTWSLAVTAVVLRIVSRQMKQVPLWLDDWLILASLVYAACICYAFSSNDLNSPLLAHILLPWLDSVGVYPPLLGQHANVVQPSVMA